MESGTVDRWKNFAADLDRDGDEAIDRLAAAALNTPEAQAAPLLVQAFQVAVSESSKRSCAAALAVAAAPDDVDSVEALEGAYRSARQDASLGPALLKMLGLYGLRCPTARLAAISALQRLKLTDTAYLLIAGAKVAALLLGKQDDMLLRQKLGGLVASDDPDIQAEVHYQLAMLALMDAFQAATHNELQAGLKRASDGFATAIDLVEFRPDASLLSLLVNLVLKFDAIEGDRQEAASAIAAMTKRLRAEVGGMGDRVFQGYKGPEAVRFAEKALDISESLESAAAEVADATRWTNFDRSVVRLAECINLIRSRPEAALGVGRIYDGLSRVADLVVMPCVGPVLMRKVGRESLAKVIANYRQLNGEDDLLEGLILLQDAERAAELSPGVRLSEEKQGKLAALAAKVNLSPDELVDEMIVVVREDQGIGWAVKVGLLPQSSATGIQGAGMSQADVVLITVNDHETDAVFAAFEAATGSKPTPDSRDDRVYHNLGTINGTTIYHALSEMGSGGVGGMQQTVDKAIRALKPGAVIAIGIAFGVNEKKQSIGDILLSKQLRPYDLQRLGADIVLRDDKPAGSARLLNHFKTFSRSSWPGAKVRDGVMLSGNKLIDNLDYRDQLLKLEAEAIGGEMEGSGLYVSSHDHGVDWIVAKAICDWADGNKKKNKEARQKKAARNAADFVVAALQYAPMKRAGSPSSPGGASRTLYNAGIEQNPTAPSKTQPPLKSPSTGLTPTKGAIKAPVTQAYSDSSLADIDFPTLSGDPVSEIILALRSHNWYQQSPAIEKIFTKLKWPERTPDEAFVLGRNIYQCAVGGENRAAAIMTDLRREMAKIPGDWAVHIVNGMFYEVYFDSEGKLREKLKDKFLTKLLALETIAKYATSVAFMRAALEPYRDRLGVLPNSTPELLEVKVQLDPNQNPSVIQSVLAGGTEYLTAVDEDGDDPASDMSYRPVSVELFPEKLRKFWQIPEGRLQVRYTPNVTEVAKLQFPRGKSIRPL